MRRPFTLHRPSSLSEAADLLREYRDAAALYAGGTELLLLFEEGLLRIEHLIDLKRVPGLEEIRTEDGSVVIWAMARYGMVVPVSPAVGNALAPLTGVRLRELPLTPERVWRALRSRRTGTPLQKASSVNPPP
jgi:CO/xanthine dehydrogenase FAD-binding subunit